MLVRLFLLLPFRFLLLLYPLRNNGWNNGSERMSRSKSVVLVPPSINLCFKMKMKLFIELPLKAGCRSTGRHFITVSTKWSSVDQYRLVKVRSVKPGPVCVALLDQQHIRLIANSHVSYVHGGIAAPQSVTSLTKSNKIEVE